MGWLRFYLEAYDPLFTGIQNAQSSCACGLPLGYSVTRCFQCPQVCRKETERPPQSGRGPASPHRTQEGTPAHVNRGWRMHVKHTGFPHTSLDDKLPELSNGQRKQDLDHYSQLPVTTCLSKITELKKKKKNH